jgi:hypothetical protein
MTENLADLRSVSDDGGSSNPPATLSFRPPSEPKELLANLALVEIEAACLSLRIQSMP